MYKIYAMLGIVLFFNMHLVAVRFPISSGQQSTRTKISVLEDKDAPTSMRAVMRPEDFSSSMIRYIDALFLVNSSAQVKESLNNVSDTTKGYLLQYVNTIDPSTLSLGNSNRLNTIVDALQTESD